MTSASVGEGKSLRILLSARHFRDRGIAPVRFSLRLPFPSKPMISPRLPSFVVAFWCLLSPATSAKVWISEIVADNATGLKDRDGDYEDWLELYNDGLTTVRLGGWSLTDNIAEPRKWILPDLTLGPNEYLVIFASGKNRRKPEEELHTNFSLSRSGEHLSLRRPTGGIEDSFGLEYPGQFENVSYGISQTSAATIKVVSVGADAEAGVPESAANFNANYVDWNSNLGSFAGPTWRSVKMGVGMDGDGSYGAWIGQDGDFEDELLNKSGSLFVRIPFSGADPSKVTRALLRMRWDDGFVAYVNGTRVASSGDPANLNWNSLATSDREEGQNDEWQGFGIDLTEVTLRAGDSNLLAIQGMNSSLNSSDLLILPELDLTVGGEFSGEKFYHQIPTPGRPNGRGATSLPPLLTEVTSKAEQPPGGANSPPIIITARVTETLRDVRQVRLYYRIMFGSEIQILMKDDGEGADEEAGDDLFTATIPTTALRRGQMIRWRVEAEDLSRRKSRVPTYEVANDSDRYFGTVAVDTSLDTSQLPILHTFVPSESAVNTRSGGRVAVYYLGEFYDNVQMDLHGQSTAGSSFPKKSYDIDFNKGNRFRWKEGEKRVKDINLLTNYADKSKVRNSMAYEFLERCGTAYHFAFPVRVQRNGSFYSVQDMVEDGDDRYLERLGLDPNGALYKMYDRMEDPNRASKKTRKEEGTSDLSRLISGLNPSQSRDIRRRFAYDNIDIPACINYLASYTVGGITDAGHKNYYMYRDTEGDGEWRILPWDVDLSAGRRWTSSQHYFYDPLHNDFWNASSINRLWELMHNTPEYRDMYLRRVEALRRTVLLSRRTRPPDDWYTQRVLELENLVDPPGVRSDADLDYSRWGSWGNGNQMRQSTRRLLTEWLARRRDWMFSSVRNQGGVRVPSTQRPIPRVTIESTMDVNPSSGNQNEEYFVIRNRDSASVDLSGWTVSGAVEFTFPPGTVIPQGNGSAISRYVGLLHVSRSPQDFRRRRSSPRANQFRFVVGGYDGQLSMRGETIELRNEVGDLVASKDTMADPLPTQEGLRIVEINYHPPAPTPAEEAALPGVIAEDFEWMEFLNISDGELDLSGVTFTEGVDFTFGDVSLPSGERLILARNPAAFALRNRNIGVPVLGPYDGFLNNDGEKIRLVDPSGENILAFDFNDYWYPGTDGEGHTLVLGNEETAWDSFGDPMTWRQSSEPAGSAGVAGAGGLQHFNAWQSSHFSRSERDEGEIGDVTGNPDEDSYPNWLEYGLGTDPLVADQGLFTGAVIEVDDAQYLGARVTLRMPNLDLTWVLEESMDGETWTEITETEVTEESQPDGLVSLTVRSKAPIVEGGSRLARLKLQLDR